MYHHAREQDTLTYLAAEARVKSLGREVVAYLNDYDVVLTPALAQLPVPIGEVHGKGPDPWDHYRRSGLFTPFTAIFNVTGLPAISLPLYQSEEGLPVAIQLGGRPAREDVLLALAAQLEQTQPWTERVPPLAPDQSSPSVRRADPSASGI